MPRDEEVRNILALCDSGSFLFFSDRDDQCMKTRAELEQICALECGLLYDFRSCGFIVNEVAFFLYLI